VEVARGLGRVVEGSMSWDRWITANVSLVVSDVLLVLPLGTGVEVTVTVGVPKGPLGCPSVCSCCRGDSSKLVFGALMGACRLFLLLA